MSIKEFENIEIVCRRKQRRDGGTVKDILIYLKECIENDISPADFDLIEDSQTKWIMDKIQDISKRKKVVKILDYGCGNMRLYNALSKTNISFIYDGCDFVKPEILRTGFLNSNCSFIDLKKIAYAKRNNYDIICLQNVIHEISILSFVEILLNVKLLLKDDGEFLLVDMSVLPKGELLGLPYFDYEILELFNPIESCFKTSKGFPIIACRIAKDEIDLPTIILEKLISILRTKKIN